MDKKRKELIISDAYDRYADRIESLDFIKDRHNYHGPKGSDNLSIFRPHNITKVVDEIFHICNVDYIDDDYRKVIDSWKDELPSDVLFSFKWQGDENVGYVLEKFEETEPVVLPSGRLSKDKTTQKNYAIVASYDFFSGNVEVRLLDDSYINALTPLVRANKPEDFLTDYQDYSNVLDTNNRNEVITITRGEWDDMLSEISKLKERIDSLEKDLRDNYTPIYNSLEE